jgi:hypothetical protein
VHARAAGGELLEPGLHVATRRLEPGQDAHDDGGEHGEPRDVEHEARGEAEVDPERELPVGDALLVGHHHRHRDPRERQPDGRRDAGQHERLHEQLSDDAPPAGAQRGADGDLAGARRRAGVDQDRHVHRHDHQ